MRKINHTIVKLTFGVFYVVLCACSTDENEYTSIADNLPPPPAIERTPSSIGIIGDKEDFTGATTSFGLVLMGGGLDVDLAMQWMIARAGGGDFIVIRASGSTGYNQYLYDFGGLNSVETLLINSRELAEEPEVAERIRQAEALFIAGGDQYDYVTYWKDTPVEDAINYLMNEKRVPVGGTSAGCAILGEVVFNARQGTIYTDEALGNPYNFRLSLQRGGFLSAPFLKEVVTDTHYNERDRQGRHVAFMARMVTDWQLSAKGIGVDERTAVCINDLGRATVMGDGNAYFIMQTAPEKKPEQCIPDEPLTWAHEGKALQAYIIPGNGTSNGTFFVEDWHQSQHTGGVWEYFWVEQGVFNRLPF